MWGMSRKRDKGRYRSPGDGLLVVPEAREAVSEKGSTSESARLCSPELRAARAAAVAAAASSTVPECWFWWRVRVVRRVKFFWQSAKGHLYGRLPECMRRCRAKELESLKGYEDCQRNPTSPFRTFSPCHNAHTCVVSRLSELAYALSKRIAV